MDSYTKHLNRNGLSYKLKHIFCHDPACWTCACDIGHGPYWHATYEEEGQLHTVFLGKEFNPLQSDAVSENRETSEHETKASSRQENPVNKAENTFSANTESPADREEVVLKPFVAKSGTAAPTVKASPPTRFDFEYDLNLLKKTFRADKLKTLYRQLTKKYHPDNYPGISHINTWMAEINGQYSELKKHTHC